MILPIFLGKANRYVVVIVDKLNFHITVHYVQQVPFQLENMIYFQHITEHKSGDSGYEKATFRTPIFLRIVGIMIDSSSTV